MIAIIIYKVSTIIYKASTATAGTAVGADEAALLVDKGFLSAGGAHLSLGLGAIGDILLERALHAVLPSVDALIIELERTHKFDDVVDRHTVAQHTRDELGIVPILGVELLRQALDSGLVATLVFKLEVIAMAAVLIGLLDYLATGDGLGQHDTFLVVLQTGENLVGIAVEQSYKSHPLLAVVLEAHHVAHPNGCRRDKWYNPCIRSARLRRRDG